MVQWLGHGSFTAGAWVQSLVRELRSCKTHSKAPPPPKKENLIQTYKGINLEDCVLREISQTQKEE